MSWLPFRFVLLTALLLGWVPIVAKSASSESEQFQARLDEASRALAGHPLLKNVSDQKRQQLTEFVVGNTLFVLLHETGHALIGEMELPVLGRDEDAADAFATLTMLKVGSALSNRVLVEAAKGWFLADLRDRKEGNKAEYYDAHGMDQQRAYQIICLMVGSNKEEFKELADQTNMPDDRQEGCQLDYKLASRSWAKVLEPHHRGAEQPKQQIEVTYWPGKGEFDMYEQTFRSLQMLEIVANHLADRHVWPHPLGLEMARCGQVGAQWQPNNRKLFVCYELAQEFAQTYRDYGQDWKVPSKDKWWQPKWWKRVKQAL